MELRQQSPRNVLIYYYIRFSIAFVIELMIASCIIFIASYLAWPIWTVLTVGALLAVQLLFYVVQPWILLKYRYYIIADNYVTKLHTFFFQKEVIVKLERVQFLKRKTGPLLNRFGLCRNSIVTAGEVIELPLMHIDKTKELERHCMNFLEKVDTDV